MKCLKPGRQHLQCPVLKTSYNNQTITKGNKGEVSKGPRDGGSPQTGDHQALSYCRVSQVRADGLFYSKAG